MLKFYSFLQSNSGGYYLFKTQKVIVQATSLDEATERAESETDVYSGMGPADCDCCGPRWDYPWNDEDGELTAGVSSWKEAKENDIVILYAN